jgi:hypothetical protein
MKVPVQSHHPTHDPTFAIIHFLDMHIDDN